MFDIAGRLETKTSFIKDLVADLRKGEIKIPKFQRPFVWKTEQALQLLDSISHNYPIGSLLLWKTVNKLKVERDIGDFKLPATDDMSPTDYVLDGQQRLTVIYSCLGAPINESGFSAGYDLRNQQFIKLTEEALPNHIFPLRLMFQTSQLLNFRTALNQNDDHTQLQDTLDMLIGVVTNYKIPVVILKELTVEEVCPIFERINSSGTRLSTYDLMVAATWTPNFDLDSEIESIANALETKGFSDINKNTILKCLSAVKYGSVKKSDLLQLRNLPNTEIRNLIERTKEAILRTIDFLTTEFNINSWEFIPYEAMVIIPTTIFVNYHKLNAEQVTKARSWFWGSSFAERYQASEHFITKDIRLVGSFILKGEESLDFPIPSIETIKRLTFSKGNSRTRAFILALSMLKPKDLVNGSLLDIHEALSSFNKKQFHHIYPKNYLKISASKGEPNALANICMLSMASNNFIRDRDPHEYLVECCDSLKENAGNVFASNLMPDPEIHDYALLEYEDFLHFRSTMLYKLMTELVKGKLVQ